MYLPPSESDGSVAQLTRNLEELSAANAKKRGAVEALLLQRAALQQELTVALQSMQDVRTESQQVAETRVKLDRQSGAIEAHLAALSSQASSNVVLTKCRELIWFLRTRGERRVIAAMGVLGFGG